MAEGGGLCYARCMAPSAPGTRLPRTPSGEGAPITSRDNRWIKEFRLALRGGVVTPSGCYGVEGVRLVEEALGSGCRITAVLFSDGGERHRTRLAPFINRAEMAFPVLRTSDRIFEGVADTEHPQGVAALVEPRAAELKDLLHPTSRAVSPTTNALTGVAPLLAVLVGVQDPGNVGTIVRTAAAFGATGVATCASGQSGTANPFGPKALRASAGAALHLPILAGMSLPILLTQLRIGGVRTLASSVREANEESGGAKLLLPWEVDWRDPVALLVGNEGAGLPEEAERSADARVRIPMATTSESLNAAAAAAVLFYEAARQRNLLTP